MILTELFDEKHIQIINDNISQITFLENLSNILFEEGYVTKSYANSLILRENQYPTGLKVEPYGVAIPHANSDQVKKSVIYVSIIKDGMQWGNMADLEDKINVNIVFNLILANDEKHIEILQKIIGLIQNQDFLKNIYESKTPKNILFQIRKELKK